MRLWNPIPSHHCNTASTLLHLLCGLSRCVIFPECVGFVVFGHRTNSEWAFAIGRVAPFLMEQKKWAHSYPFQSILTLCSKVRIAVIITEVHFCFIAMRKLLVSASTWPSCSYYKKEKGSQHTDRNKF